MNAIEKIIAAHAGLKTVKPGQIVDVKLDYVMANDATTTLAIDVFQKELKGERVFDREQVVLVMDHYTPCCTVDAAETHKKMRRFGRDQELKYVYDGVGVCHQLMLEHHAKPGDFIIGADSHTCSYGAIGALSTGMGSTDVAVGWMEGKVWIKVPSTIKIRVSGKWPKGVYSKDLVLKLIGDLTAKGATYKALVFEGEAIRDLTVSERATLCNMGIEAGAKFAYVQPDEKVKAFMKKMGREYYPVIEADADADASYERVLTYNVADLEPQIAYPHSVDQVKPLSDFEGLEIDEVFLGACTNGRFEDLEIAAAILKGKKISDKVRMLITPASNAVYMEAMERGLIRTFIESGAMISTPGCSACFGGTIGIIGPGERLLTTANRNFKGRVGSPDGEIYLASPATAAASALYGEITDPRKVI
jgi:3-isopropylmalate/(R)-2-methylmalate dehydratase large subunit